MNKCRDCKHYKHNKKVVGSGFCNYAPPPIIEAICQMLNADPSTMIDYMAGSFGSHMVVSDDHTCDEFLDRRIKFDQKIKEPY